jgi:hypothetical protein
MKELVSVVVPILNPELAVFEQEILDNCVEKLGKYTIIFIHGESAPIASLKERYEGVDFIKFPDKYFASRKSLSVLLLMEDFYERFSWSDYILIHELNSWIVKDELHYWCKQGYDYLKGEPEGGGVSDFGRFKGLNSLQKLALDKAFTNNGIQLCHIDGVRKILRSKSTIAYEYRQHPEWTNADALFWELEANRFWPKLRMTTRIVLKRFAESAQLINANSKQDRHVWPFALINVQTKNIEDLPSFL